MPLQTRKPTGKPAYPLILVEGEEKAGKSFTALALSSSPLVHRTFAFDLGDGVADEYAALGPYEVVELTGTFSNLFDQVALAVAEPSGPNGEPNVFVIDSGTDLWDNLKRWTDTRARRSRNGQRTLQQDPDAEVDASMNLWNDAKDRWASIVNMLRRSGGIGIITAQGAEVAKVQGGQPVAGQTVWSIQAEKTLASAVTAWVRVKRDPRTATLVGARRLGLEVPTGGLVLPLDATLHHLVFEVIGAGTSFEAPKISGTEVGLSKPLAMRRLLDAVVAASPQLSEDEAKAEARAIWQAAGYTDAELTTGQVALLLDAAGPPPQGPPPSAQGPDALPAPEADETDATGHTAGVAEPQDDPARAALAEHGDAIVDSWPEGDGIEVPPAHELPILTAGQITGMRKVELVAELAARHQPTNGTVEVLAARLADFEQARAAAEAEG